MCIILHALNSKAATAAALNSDNLREAWTGNPHGAGLAYRAAPGSRVRIIKGLMSADALCAAASMIARTVRPYEVAVHLRFATHGSKGPDMTHPFRCEWGAFIHNGILRGPGLVARAGESDTAAAARIIGRVEPRAALSLVRDAWLSGSRVLLMRHGAEPLRAGEWHKATVAGLTLSQAYSLPRLVAGGGKAKPRQSSIFSHTGSALLDDWRGGGWDAEASVSSLSDLGAGSGARACGDTLSDDVAAAQEAARIAAEDRADEARERAAVREVGRRRRERRALGMGPAAPLAVRKRGDPETLAAVEAAGADAGSTGRETALPALPMSDGQAAADLGLPMLPVSARGDGMGQS